MAAVEQYLNNPQTTLDGGINSSVTTIAVAANPADVPSSGQFRILVGSEYMLVTAVSGLNWTVVRGVEGSGAASHADLTVVVAILTVQGLLNLSRQSLNGTNISARRELNFVDSAKVTWTLTDDPTNNKVDIEADSTGGGGGGGSDERPFVVPVLADFSWTNQGVASAVMSTNSDTIILRSGTPAAGGDNYHCFMHAVTPPYSVIMRIKMLGKFAHAADAAGPCFVESSTSKLIPIVYAPIGSVINLTGYRFTNPSTFSGATEFAAVSTPPIGVSSIWWKLEDDNTNRKVSISHDGYEWILFSSIARTTFMTANRVGFYANTFTGSTNIRVICSSFEM